MKMAASGPSPPTSHTWLTFRAPVSAAAAGPASASSSGDAVYCLRDAVAADLPAVHRMIYDLAVYEKEEQQMTLSLEQFTLDSGLDPRPGVPESHEKKFRCLVAERTGRSGEDAVESETQQLGRSSEVVAYALYFYTYSTWEGRALYLEDVFVKPEVRSAGLGTKIMFCIAKIASSENCCRFQWQCIDWNKPSLEFYYKKLKAEERTETNDAKWVNIMIRKDRIEEMATEFDGITKA